MILTIYDLQVGSEYYQTCLHYKQSSNSQAKLLKIKPHKLRSLSDFLNFISLDEIITAAVW